MNLHHNYDLFQEDKSISLFISVISSTLYLVFFFHLISISFNLISSTYGDLLKDVNGEYNLFLTAVNSFNHLSSGILLF